MVEKFCKGVKGKTFVFIDAANLERSVQAMWVNPKDISDKFKKYQENKLCWRVDYKKLKRFFEKHSDLKKIIFYSARFDNTGHDKFLTVLKNDGYGLKTKALKEYRDHTIDHPHRKANFDVEITADAVYLLEKYDSFVLFSGDCDFEYLLKFLRGQNKITAVFSKKGHVAKELPPASNYYFDIIDFRSQLLKLDLKKAKIPPKRDSAFDDRRPCDNLHTDGIKYYFNCQLAGTTNMDNLQNRTLFFGDNLKILRDKVQSDPIDLIIWFPDPSFAQGYGRAQQVRND